MAADITINPSYLYNSHREVGGVRQHTIKIAVHSSEGCFTATTMALTAIKQKFSQFFFSLLFLTLLCGCLECGRTGKAYFIDLNR